MGSLSFEWPNEFSVIACVDIFFCSGTTPLATVGQSTIKIRLRKYIDAAQHESESMTTLESANDDSVGLFRRSTVANYVRLSST